MPAKQTDNAMSAAVANGDIEEPMGACPPEYPDFFGISNWAKDYALK